MSTMTLDRFDDLASAYGGAIFLWPAEVQADAEAFAAAAPEAQAVLARERALDEALDEWEAPEPSQALMARILGDAAEVSAMGAAPVTEAPPAADPPGFLTRFFGDFGWRPAGALTACLAIGFVAGLSGAPAPVETGDMALAAQDNAVIATFFGEDDESDPFDLELL